MLPRVRAGLAGLVLAVLSCLAVFVSAAEAQAATYRFWAYYQWSGSQWQFATASPQQVTPAEGSVEGWRFAVSGEEAPRPPRAGGDFDLICGDTPAEQGNKRVAVVIDYGTEADAEGGAKPPAARGACAVVPAAATGLDVLAAVAEQRVEGGLVCAIDTYPATGCGGIVEGAAPTGQDEPVELQLPQAGEEATAASRDTGQQQDDGLSTGVILAIGAAAVAVVALVVGATMQARRTRT
jgi:hypothetical protein